MRNIGRIVGLLVMSVFAIHITGCSTPKHTNLLIFGTNTKLAVDMSYSTVSQSPGITVGYTRQEFVLLPLLANADNDGNAVVNTAAGYSVPCNGGQTGVGQSASDKQSADKIPGEKKIAVPQHPVPDAKNQNTQSGHDYMFKGNQSQDYDTYSVVAVFDTSIGSGSSVGIKQFFATGLAARKIAENAKPSPPDPMSNNSITGNGKSAGLAAGKAATGNGVSSVIKSIVK